MIHDTTLGDWLKSMNLGHPLTIAGPCSAETQEQVLNIAHQLSVPNSRVSVFRAGVWKPRTRPGNFEGIGALALPWLQQIKKETGLLTAVEVANANHVQLALEHDVDILWIGARTTVNPFAVQEIADALKGTDKIVWVKNPVNPDLELWIGAFERLYAVGIRNLGAVHRGFSVYNKSQYRNIPNWQIPIDFKSKLPQIPLICDPSHICGRRDCIESVGQTALDLQFDGLMIETHHTPDQAWSDAMQQITPETLHQIINRLTVREKTFQDAKHINLLSDLRHDIDRIDKKILDVLAERMQIVNRIGQVKKEQNVAVLQNVRFNEIMSIMIEKASELGLSSEFISAIFKDIHQESIRQQEKIVNR